MQQEIREKFCHQQCMAQFLANQVAVEDHNIVHSQLQPLLSPAMLSCSHNAIVSYLWNCYLGAAGGGFPVDDDLHVVHAVVAAVAGTAIVPNLQSPIARLDFAAGRFSLTYAPEWLLELMISMKHRTRLPKAKHVGAFCFSSTKGIV